MSDNIVELVMEKENWTRLSTYFPWIQKTIDRIITQIDEKICKILRDHKKQYLKSQT
jgi:hypothetical protein